MFFERFAEGLAVEREPAVKEKSFIRLLATPSLTIASNCSAPQWHLALLELSGEPMALRK
jgi:hypothetical protein